MEKHIRKASVTTLKLLLWAEALIVAALAGVTVGYSTQWLWGAVAALGVLAVWVKFVKHREFAALQLDRLANQNVKAESQS